MAVYLGSAGCVELKRTSVNRDFSGTLEPSDVNTIQDRFSFDFPKTALITGDRLLISTVDGSDLVLIDDGIQADTRAAYARVDAIGGITLYDRFQDAINQQYKLPLKAHSSAQQIKVKVKDLNFNTVAQISQYTITTTRETIDLTCLSDDFKRQYASGLISGQGTLTCFWDYKHGLCDVATNQELAQYFCQLILRVQLGASFIGRFLAHTGEGSDDVWYEAQAIVTNTSLSFEPTEPISCEIQFVFTEEIELKVGEMPSALLLESSDSMLQERQEGLILTADQGD